MMHRVGRRCVDESRSWETKCERPSLAVSHDKGGELCVLTHRGRIVGRLLLHGSEVPFSRMVGRLVLHVAEQNSSFVTDPFSGDGASFVTDLFSGWGGEFCDRPFFRDEVASFVTDPFLGVGARGYVT